MALDEDGYLTGNENGSCDDDYTEDDRGTDNHSNTTADGYNDNTNTKFNNNNNNCSCTEYHAT